VRGPDCGLLCSSLIFCFFSIKGKEEETPKEKSYMNIELIASNEKTIRASFDFVK